MTLLLTTRLLLSVSTRSIESIENNHNCNCTVPNKANEPIRRWCTDWNIGRGKGRKGINKTIIKSKKRQTLAVCCLMSYKKKNVKCYLFMYA